MDRLQTKIYYPRYSQAQLSQVYRSSCQKFRGQVHAFELKASETKRISAARLYRVISNRTLYLGNLSGISDLQIERWGLVLPPISSDIITNVLETRFKSAEVFLWTFDGQNVAKHIDIPAIPGAESPLATINSLVSKSLWKELEASLKTKRSLTAEQSRSALIDVYNRGYQDSEKERERSELKEAFFADFLMGGFLAGGIVLLALYVAENVDIQYAGALIPGLIIVLALVAFGIRDVRKKKPL